MTALVANANTWLTRITSLWNEYLQFRAQHRAYKETVAELSRLSDAELRDIGLHRGDIHSIAMETHFDNRGAR
jgi:uncharacterized protein YjiS (DUF1127 family)